MDDQPLTYDTPAGELGVLICADSWYLEPYETLAAQGPDFIVVPNNYFTEGGWDAGEVEGAVEEGFTPVGLCGRILRTETAAIAACAILQYAWGGPR